jgi:DNA-binding XRE family transcriptional regulator
MENNERQLYLFNTEKLPEEIYASVRTIGELIGNARRYRMGNGERELTQQGLADRMGVHISTIARVETDNVGLGFDLWYNICDLLGIDASKVTLGMRQKSRKC